MQKLYLCRYRPKYFFHGKNLKSYKHFLLPSCTETKRGLACASKTNCYSKRLSWAIVLTYVNSFVQENKGVCVWERTGYLAMSFGLKEHYRPVSTVIKRAIHSVSEFAMFQVEIYVALNFE